MTRSKIAFVGSGNIGGVAALLATQAHLGDVVMFDIDEGVAKGKALDISQAQSILGLNASIEGTSRYEDLQGSDVVIVTAGSPRKPGMSRDDLLKINGNVMTQVARGIATYCPKAFVIVVTNPLDVMVWVMQKESGLPTSHVVGMAGVLDAARYSFFLAQAMNVAIADVQSIVLGGHGDLMVPIRSGASVRGIPLVDLMKSGLIDEEQVQAIIDRTRFGGGEIVDLLKTGSAYNAPAAACIQMAKSYLRDEKSLLPCATYLNGEYGFKGLYAGVPTVIGKEGAERIIQLPLIDSEKLAFEASIKAVETLIEAMEDILGS